MDIKIVEMMVPYQITPSKKGSLPKGDFIPIGGSGIEGMFLKTKENKTKTSTVKAAKSSTGTLRLKREVKLLFIHITSVRHKEELLSDIFNKGN